MEHLISKYLQNELTEAEASELKHWLEKDSLNRKVFENIVGEWRLSEDEVAETQARVLNDILSRQEVQKNSKQGKVIRYMARIAAVLVLGFGLSFVVMNYTDIFNHNSQVENNVLIEKEAANGQKLTFELPDGSIVKLNSGSKLIYPRSFQTDQRAVRLVGEAFFEVERDENRPFRIISEKVNVQVLGTSFNVKSYPDDSNVSVAVRSGKVGVTNADNKEELFLIKEEMAVYQPETDDFQKQPIADPELVFGWTEQNLIFRDQEISEIVEVLSRWYDVEFKLQKDLDANKLFTAKYKNPSLRAVMESLSYAYDFNYELDGKKVTIK